MRNTNFSMAGKLLSEFDRFIKIIDTEPKPPTVKTPNSESKDVELNSIDKKNIQGLMRINHTGEICAQALYYGQALFAKDSDTHDHLIKAAQEEENHLYWCDERLTDLNAKTSIFNPFWYANSFALGAVAGLFGDKISYGFVIEVEKQVENHLQEHIEQVPKDDTKTLAILKKMQEDEIRHGQEAKDAGGVELPDSIKKIMTHMANLMKAIAYRV